MPFYILCDIINPFWQITDTEDFMAERKNENLINDLFFSLEGFNGKISRKDFARKLDELTKKGEQINKIKSVGDISLTAALIYSERTDLLDELIERKVKMDKEDASGNQPIVYAHDIKTVDYLISNSADINAKDKSGFSVLMRAVQNGNTDFINALIEKGADTNTVNKEGQTLMHHAVMNGDIDLVKKLQKEHGLDINAKDKSGYTPLDTLMNSEYSDSETIKMLKDLGAKANVGYKHSHATCNATLRSAGSEYQDNGENLNYPGSRGASRNA